MTRLLCVLTVSFLAATAVQAGELDREFGPKAPTTPVMTTLDQTTPFATTGWSASELDGETPTQACGWRRGWGFGLGWGGWNGGWGGGWNGGWGGGWAVSRPVWGGGWGGGWNSGWGGGWGGGWGSGFRTTTLIGYGGYGCW